MKFGIKQNKTLGVSSLIGATFLYGWFGVLSKLIAYDLPIFYASATRDIFALLILTIPLYLTRRKNFRKIEKADYKWITLRSFFGLLAFLGSYISFVYLEIGTAYFIFYGGSTVFGFLLGRLLFQEKITWSKGLALLLAVLGLYTIYQINISANNGLYILLAGLGGMATAIWNIFSKKVSDKYSALQLNFLDFLIVLVFTILFSILKKEAWVMPEFSIVWLYNLLFATIFIVNGQLMVIGFNNLDAQIGSLIMLTEILFGIILGFFLFKEVVTVLTLVGGMLIVTAVILPELSLEKKSFWQKLFKR